MEAHIQYIQYSRTVSVYVTAEVYIKMRHSAHFVFPAAHEHHIFDRCIHSHVLAYQIEMQGRSVPILEKFLQQISSYTRGVLTSPRSSCIS